MHTKSATVLVVLFIGLVSAAGAVAFQEAGSGEIGYWKLDDAAGPTAADSAGTSPLPYSGSPTPSTDVPAVNFPDPRSLSFDGVDDGLAIGAVSGLAAGNSVHSLSAWIKVTALPPNRAWILLLGNEGAGSHHWLLNNTGGTQFGVWNGTQVQPTLTVGAWTHVATTFDGTTLKGYLNGTEIGSVAATFNLQGIPLTVAQIHIGENYFNGKVDDLRLYGRVLTPTEVASLAAGDSGPSAPVLSGTYGATSTSLTWTGSATVFNVKRSTYPGGPYTTIASNVAGTSYTDNSGGASYYYVVSGVTFGEGPNSNELAPPVTATPATGLQTSEQLTSTSFTIKYNVPAPAGGSLVQVFSNDTTEGTVSTTYGSPTPLPSGNGFEVLVPQGDTPTITVTVTGVNDDLVDGAQPYTISVTAGGMGIAIPDIQCTNQDNDSPGITIGSTVGLVTTEGGGQATFKVSLNTQPFGPITMSLTSSNPAEASVSPSSITFDSGNWFVEQVVTVTGVDDAAIDFTQGWTIVTGTLQTTNPSDSAYVGLNPSDVMGMNLDNESIPPAPGAWGKSGGGCGLLGLEIALPLLLLRIRRRRSIIPA